MEKEEVQTIAVKIVDEGKQLVVRFPLEVAREFNINPEKDSFFWIIERSKDGASLKGLFMKDEKKN